MKSNYRRIGDFIIRCNNRNAELETTNLLGISIDKYFMPSVANVQGTDLSKYKLVQKNQFACNRMHVGRDARLPVALSSRYESFIVSPAYDVFEIENVKELLPEYLMMWFSRKEFDRNTWFFTDSDVRGKLGWEDFCNMELPVPSIEKQRAIVKEYNTITNRIKLNEQLNQKLEATAQAVYKHWFVDFEFPDENGKPYKSNGGKMVWNDELEKEIPVGWEALPIADFCVEMTSGGTPNRSIIEYWSENFIPWIKTGELNNKIIVEAKEYISRKGFDNSSAKKLPINTVLIALYGQGNTKGQVGYLRIEATTNQACCAMICENGDVSSYLYYFLRTNRDKIVSFAIGGAQPNLSNTLIGDLKILRPKQYLFKRHPFVRTLEAREAIEKESIKLKSIRGLLLSKMSKP